LQEKFRAIGERWADFLAKLEQPLKITQWEVTYINHILTPDGRPGLTDALSFFSGELTTAMGGAVEAGSGRRILLSPKAS